MATRGANIRSPRRARRNVTARIQTVKGKLKNAKDAGKKKKVKRLRERVKSLKEKRQTLTEKIKAQKASRTTTTTSAVSVGTPTARGGGNQARNTLAALQKRTRAPSNLGISSSNPLN